MRGTQGSGGSNCAAFGAQDPGSARSCVSAVAGVLGGSAMLDRDVCIQRHQLHLSDNWRPAFQTSRRSGRPDESIRSCFPSSAIRPSSSTTMRSAMRTVENRCEINSAILPAGQFGEALKHLEFAARVERRSGLVEDQHLRVAQVGAGQRDLLPFAAGKIDAAFEAAAQHLLVTVAGACAITSSARLFCADASKQRKIVEFFDAADRNVLAWPSFHSA